MLYFAQPIPAEEKEADKSGFEEKGHQAFDRQRGTEDIADIVRVIRPVGAKLEFHSQARCDTQRKVDAKQLAPEFGHVFVDLFTRQDIDGFHDR